MRRLITAEDRHFTWLLGEAPAPAGLREIAGGVDVPAIITILRGVATSLHMGGCFAAWLIVENDTVCGICSFMHLPDAALCAEIGYGVAVGARDRGLARFAVADIIRRCRVEGLANSLIAGTAIGNIPSQCVLISNGFKQAGERLDPDDGRVLLWCRPV